MSLLRKAGTLLELVSKFRTQDDWIDAARDAGYKLDKIRTGLLAIDPSTGVVEGEWDKRSRLGWMDI